MARLPWPLPAPRELGWTLKPMESARTSMDRLPDGHLELRIEHSVVRGITTEMLAWWFQMFDGETSYRSQRIAAYLLWHPLDHVSLSVTRDRAGRVAPSQRIHIREVFGRDPRFAVDQVVTIHRWDTGGIGFHLDHLGHRVFSLDHTFEDLGSGVRYRSHARIGAARGPLRPLLNRLFVPRLFGEEKARAWLRHNVEEVGCFEEFLPEIYAQRPKP